MHALLRSVLFVALLLMGAPFSSAQSPQEPASSDLMSKVTFPVTELGGCESRAACKLYCDKEANRDACFSYAQRVGLMSKEKVSAARLILSKKGPGACGSREACVTYCSDSSHQDECLSFAQTQKIITEERVGLIRKIMSGEAPGACKSAETCRMYCADPAHGEECRSFAQAHGLAPKMASSTRAQMVKDVLASTTPGRERGMELKAANQGNSTPPPDTLKNPARPGSSSTSPEAMKKLPPPRPAPDNIGAAAWHGFLRLIGF